MTKQQLAEALKRAKEIRNDSTRLASESYALALGYLEMAVEQYLRQTPTPTKEALPCHKS